MPHFKIIILFSLTLASCKEEPKDSGVLEDCPTIALPCPEGQVPCNIETDNDPCEEVVLGEEPCTQTRYCAPG